MSKFSWNNILNDLINNGNLSEHEKADALLAQKKLKDMKINLLVTGATGCGKSSTINALFNGNVAKVGQGVDPETMEITKYEWDNLVIWDSPGLGDGKEADERHSKNIINKLLEKDKDGNALIDVVLVILDGGSRDLGTSYELITEVIIKTLQKTGENNTNRLLIAINQCDMAMKGRNWNHETNQPEPALINFLEEKVLSTRNRIEEATGVSVTPIYYSAGYKDGNHEQKPYNITRLLKYIVSNTPKKKRAIYVENVNAEEIRKDTHENKEQERKETKNLIEESFFGLFGSLATKAVEVIGNTIGGGLGAIISVGKKIWDFFF